MRLIIFLLFLIINLNCFSQVLVNISETNLYQEIQKQKAVPFESIGFAGKNMNYLIIDSFKKLVGTERFLTFINDTNYSLKYWAYINLLQENDSMAFEFIKNEITNDTCIDFQFPGCHLLPIKLKFNIAIITIYEYVVRLRYKEGASGTICSIPFTRKEKNLKKWKYLRKNLKKLIKINKIEIKSSDYYS